MRRWVRTYMRRRHRWMPEPLVAAVSRYLVRTCPCGTGGGCEDCVGPSEHLRDRGAR